MKFGNDTCPDCRQIHPHGYDCLNASRAEQEEIKSVLRRHLEYANAAGFKWPLGEGKFVVAGTPETIRNLLDTEGT